MQHPEHNPTSQLKTLVLTEKPSVAADFARALGVNGKRDGYSESADYIITWAVGHLVELLDPEEYDPRWKAWRLDRLPILPEQFLYKPISRAEKQLNIIKSLLARKDVGDIVIATDAGREGEVIARTILLFAGKIHPARIRRFWTSQALTPQVVRDGMNHLKPASDYDRLWQAGQARQIADWLVGMNGTRAATRRLEADASKKNGGKKAPPGKPFSVGRVQTAVLGLMADRLRERENFNPEPYWLLRALFVNEKGEWKGTWFKKDQSRFDKEDTARQVMEKISGKTGKVTSVKRQKKKQPPPPLYSLTDLQQEANRKFGLSATATLDIAQRLYEQRKCLSYPRTDSRVLGSKGVDMARKLVKDLSAIYSQVFAGVRHDLIKASNKRVFDDARLTDHHALIPLAALPQNASGDEQKIYTLVLKRFAAAFHPDHEYEQTEIITEVEKETFRTRGRRPLVAGWRAVYDGEDPENAPKKDDEEEADNLPGLEKGDPALVKQADMEKKMTQPPPEYTEALLLKDMTNPSRYVAEDSLKKIYRGDVGLGTQATRAQIIETLLMRGYVVREKKKIRATEKGCLLVDALRAFRNAGVLTSAEETARWEMQLNGIAQGEGSDAVFLYGIQEMVKKMVDEFKESAGQNSLGQCPACGGEVTEGNKGYGCANWREADGGCRFVIWKEIAKKAISKEMASELLTKKIIGPFADFVSKKGKPFTGSLKLVLEEEKWAVKFDFDNNGSAVSETQGTPGSPNPPSASREVIGKCPACGGNVIVGNRGYGCANWKPENGGCRFVIWKTIAQKELSLQSVQELLEKGETGLLFGFMSRKGNAFAAKLKLVKGEDEKFSVVFDFPDRTE